MDLKKASGYSSTNEMLSVEKIIIKIGSVESLGQMTKKKTGLFF